MKKESPSLMKIWQKYKDYYQKHNIGFNDFISWHKSGCVSRGNIGDSNGNRQPRTNASIPPDNLVDNWYD